MSKRRKEKSKKVNKIRNERLISVRLPRSLHQELTRLAKEKHFMDLSEEMRFILRRRWLEMNPSLLDEKADKAKRARSEAEARR